MNQKYAKKKPQKNSKIPRFNDVDGLKQRIQLETPQRGVNYLLEIYQIQDYLYEYKLKQALADKNNYEEDEFQRKYKLEFEDLPISLITKRALQSRKFRRMTEIQRCVIPHALGDRDIIAASRTGSGKTLCYLIPMIELLYRNLWTPLDGLGGLIILPTRELAMQVFEVYNSISVGHILSVGLLIGGKNLKQEQQLIQGMNILICTPGRLLQHFEETAGFEASNLKLLVIDEADTLFEMGFMDALQTIISYIPSERQTFLFSATLSQDIHQVSRFSMVQPEMILLHQQNRTENSGIANIYETPVTLKQHYMVIKVDEKMDVLFSFIKAHLRDKILVFFSSCKQVRFMYEAFRKLRMGTPMFELHGRQKQAKRMAIYFTFAEKRFSTLLTTNVAARGLDFPKIDWVIQFDCPEDIQTYVHRIGRTARYKAGGNSLLMLIESEVKMIQKLEQKGIKIKQIHLNPNKQMTVRNTVQSFVSEFVDLKYLAQRAFISYMRSVYLSSDKEVFDVMKINHNDLAESYGLVQTPVIRFKKIEAEEQQDIIKNDNQVLVQKKSKVEKLREKIKQKKQEKIQQIENQIDQEEEEQEVDRMTDVKHMKTITRKGNNEQFEKMKAQKTFENNDEDLMGGLFKKRGELQPINEKTKLILSKRQLKKIKLDGHFGGRNKIYFDEEGNSITYEQKRRLEILQNQNQVLTDNVDFTQELYQKLQENAEKDRENEINRRKIKKMKKKSNKIQEQAQDSLIESEDEQLMDDD